MLRKIKFSYNLPDRQGYRLLLPAISAILLILAYPKFDIGFLAWVAFIPLFFAINHKNIIERAIAGYFFGIVSFSGILYWLFNITVPGAIAVILFLSTIPSLFCLLTPPSIIGRPWSVIYVPAAWVLTEYLRSHIFTGFPWALLGYSQCSNLPVIQVADLTGAYGVSFLVMVVNFCIFKAIRTGQEKNSSTDKMRAPWIYVLFFALIAYIAVLGYGQNRIRRVYPPQNLRVAVIQGNIPQEKKWDARYEEYIMNKYKLITEKALEEKPRLLIWPETSVPGYLEEEYLVSMIIDIARKNNVFILAGMLRGEADRVFNSAVLFSDKGETLGYYDKIHLVPMGEFIPFRQLFSWIRGFINKPIGDFDRGNAFTVFRFRLSDMILSQETIQRITQFHSFSTLICFEDIFPDLSRNFVKKGARFLVNITNDAWFGNTAAPYQHVQASVFRAVENKVPVVRAANTGVSCIISPNGKIITTVKEGRKEIFVDGYAVGTIPSPPATKTVYTRFGDVFSWICVGFVLFAILMMQVTRSRR